MSAAAVDARADLAASRSAAVIAYIGVGANLGDRVSTIEAALDAIAALPRTRLVARSSLYASAPVDADGDDYVNAVAQVSTGLDPHALLAALQAIEARHGRTRSHRNAPRTLDLDLLLHGGESIDTPTLVVPHPRIAERAFVLLPLAEVAPGLVVPGAGPVEALMSVVRTQRIAKL